MAGFVLAATAGADTFHPLSSITTSTSNDFFPVNNLIEGPGAGFDSSEPHDRLAPVPGNGWVTDLCGFPCDYFGSLPPPVLTVDLGQNQPLDEISLWGYDNTNANGAKTLRLRFATEAEGTGGFGTSITYSPTLTALNNDTSRQSFVFSELVTARYVEVVITDNYYTPPGFDGGDRVGLGEIAFSVPDPSGIAPKILVTAPRDFSVLVGDIGTTALSFLATENIWSAELHEATGDVYFSAPTSNSIFKINITDDPPVGQLFAFNVGAVFHGLAIDEVNGLLYALDSGADALFCYQLSSGSNFGILGNMSGFQRPNDVVYDRSLGSPRFIVTDSGLDRVMVFDGAGNLDTTLADANTVGAWGIAIDPGNGDILFSSHDRGEIRRWNGASNASTLEHSGLDGPRGLGYDRWGRLYCVEGGTGNIVTFGPAPLPTYANAPGGRDVELYAECDLNGNLIPDEWETTASVFAFNYRFGDDPDKDGRIVGIEAALGLKVNDGDDGNGGLTTTVDPNGDITVSHLALRKNDFVYSVYISGDISTWNLLPGLPAVVPFNANYDTWSYRFNLADVGIASTISPFFLRANVFTREQ
ncbi:MAG: hypothetical protein AAGJ79_05060 [Verrucomicrobiota bacterium]